MTTTWQEAVDTAVRWAQEADRRVRDAQQHHENARDLAGQTETGWRHEQQMHLAQTELTLADRGRQHALMWRELAPLLPAVAESHGGRAKCPACGCIDTGCSTCLRDCARTEVDRSSDAADRPDAGLCITCGHSMNYHHYIDTSTSEVTCRHCGRNCTETEIARARSGSAPGAMGQRELCPWRLRASNLDFACTLDAGHDAMHMSTWGGLNTVWVSEATGSYTEGLIEQHVCATYLDREGDVWDALTSARFYLRNRAAYPKGLRLDELISKFGPLKPVPVRPEPTTGGVL